MLKLRREKLLQWLTPFFKAFPDAKAFFVGGLVRDAVLGHISKDLDLVISHVPAKELFKFLKTAGQVNLVGKRFGVFKFIPRDTRDREAIDIALPRTEQSRGSGAYRDFDIKTDHRLTIEEDLGRRDLTINAMAWDIKNRRLIDPWHGRQDLQQKNIRTVGKPQDRFNEDASRLLRAIRLACQLHFKIEPHTRQAIKKNIGLLEKKVSGARIVPYEVIGKELVKALTLSPTNAVHLLDDCGALKLLAPELAKTKKIKQGTKYHTEGTLWQHLLLALKKLESADFKKTFPGDDLNAELVMATLLHDLGKTKTQRVVSKQEIHFYGHEVVGAAMAKRLCERLKLNQYPKTGRFGLTADNIWWLIKNHLLALKAPAELKNNTLEKYYFSMIWPSKNLLRVQWADISASLRANGRPDMKPFKALKTRLNDLSQNKQLPKPLLTGEEVMRILNVKAGPTVGRALNWLREEQLSGKIKSKAKAKHDLINIFHDEN